jgi:hypothetical protein
MTTRLEVLSEAVATALKPAFPLSQVTTSTAVALLRSAKVPLESGTVIAAPLTLSLRSTAEEWFHGAGAAPVAVQVRAARAVTMPLAAVVRTGPVFERGPETKSLNDGKPVPPVSGASFIVAGSTTAPLSSLTTIFTTGASPSR